MTKLKCGEMYYTFHTNFSVIHVEWEDHPVDFALLKAGWVFSTREEAEKMIPTVKKELGIQ